MHVFYFFAFRGNDFRKDFKGLDGLKAFFPSSPTLTLTATAPQHLIMKLKESLCLSKDCKIISKNPNRKNIFLNKQKRLSNTYGYESYENILRPIAESLLRETVQYPLTIIYLKLKYCGFAYHLFDQILNKNQYQEQGNGPPIRLFAQFHSQQTTRMKEEIIAEIRKEVSITRVVFATTALGMGVNALHVRHVIHIGPPSNLETYFQEIGRAGRCGEPAMATLYYNNSDIASNKTNIDDSMRMYCQTDDVCLRKILLEYFGFSDVNQEKCCSVCDSHYHALQENKLEQTKQKKVRMLSSSQLSKLYEEIKEIIIQFESKRNTCYNSLYCEPELPSATTLMEGIEYIYDETDLLSNYGIYDELCAKQLISVINTYN